MAPREPDLIVVGAGMCGSEAAYACARAGLSVLLITTSLDTVYNLSGSGARVKPPAGSLMARLVFDAPESIATFTLHRRAKAALETEPNLHLLQSSVSGLIVEAGRVVGVTTWEGVDRRAPRVALCAGSFLQARLHIGTLTETAGRLSEMAYDDLYDDLERLGFMFEEMTLEALETPGTLPYTVRAQRFAPAEWDAAGFTLRRLGGLYAAGVCVAGYLTYEAAAEQGLMLAAHLLTNPEGSR